MVISVTHRMLAVEIDKGRELLPASGNMETPDYIVIHGDGEHPMFINYRNEEGDLTEYGLHTDNMGKSRRSVSVAVTEREFKMKRFAAFIADLARNNNIPCDRIIRHKDATGRICPEFADDVRWVRFIRKVRAALDKTSES